MADSSVKATSVDSNALYYEVSPTLVCILRLYNVAMLLMILEVPTVSDKVEDVSHIEVLVKTELMAKAVEVAFILCLVKGHENNTHYLLASNLVLSSLISIVVNWWYRNGDLSADKHWYIFLIASVIIFQCITTDVYVFHKGPPPSPEMSTTPHKPPVTWVTINSSTLAPPTTRHSF